MNGAQALMKTLADAGVSVCFSNPGTSEMHFVAALDREPRMRAVLTLFEGVATGAADGYARMAGRPAATLLHLGCGLGNGLANLHNARKGRVPVVNIVGDHATYHVKYDAQLQSDIETVARNVSTWVRTSASTGALGDDAAQAVAAAMGPPGQVATLILPADVSWSEGGMPALPLPMASPPVAEEATIDAIIQALRSGGRTALLLGARALREPGLLAASRIAAHTGAGLFAEVFPTRIERGAGLPHVERLAYFAELAAVQLHGLEHLILVDAKSPVSFFAYPGKASDLVPEGCTVHTLASPIEDALGGLQRLATRIGADAAAPVLQAPVRPDRPRGKLTAEKVCKAVGHLLPERAIIVDEAQTSGVLLPHFTRGAPRHDVVTLTGGAIGQGLPNAVGVAIACPDRPVLALVGDGSAMYTLQALWTMAREKLNVTTIVLNNRSYAILNVELQRMGATGSGNGAGEKARAQLELGNPGLDFVRMGAGMGVHAVRATTADELVDALDYALRAPGPHLIEAVVPSAFSGLKLRLLPHVLGSLARLPQPLARALKRKVSP
ncbi:MAG: acetolactate synthase large subunit [Steroidobacteraceae bacterium]|nr:acetolactate synthase large subunit [Steroidobacteraceae bacterium]